MRIDGACHCGAIAYEAEVDPGAVYFCHCTDCQAISGGSGRWAVTLPAESFRLLSGTPAEYLKTGDSGMTSHQLFCGTCAAPLYAYSTPPNMPEDGPQDGHQDGPQDGPSAAPAEIKLRLGTARQRNQLPPRMEFFPASAQAWARLRGEHGGGGPDGGA